MSVRSSIFDGLIDARNRYGKEKGHLGFTRMTTHTACGGTDRWSGDGVGFFLRCGVGCSLRNNLCGVGISHGGLISGAILGPPVKLERKNYSWPNGPFFAGRPNDHACPATHATKRAMVRHVLCSSLEVRPSFIIHVVYPLLGQ